MLGGPADVVLSDMAANATGHARTDHLKIMALVEAAAEFAREVLAPGGSVPRQGAARRHRGLVAGGAQARLRHRQAHEAAGEPRGFGRALSAGERFSRLARARRLQRREGIVPDIGEAGVALAGAIVAHASAPRGAVFAPLGLMRGRSSAALFVRERASRSCRLLRSAFLRSCSLRANFVAARSVVRGTLFRSRRLRALRVCTDGYPVGIGSCRARSMNPSSARVF